jgi:hypothetical protein
MWYFKFWTNKILTYNLDGRTPEEMRQFLLDKFRKALTTCSSSSKQQ